MDTGTLSSFIYLFIFYFYEQDWVVDVLEIYH